MGRSAAEGLGTGEAALLEQMIHEDGTADDAAEDLEVADFVLLGQRREVTQAADEDHADFGELVEQR